MTQPEQSPWAPRPEVKLTPADHPGIDSDDIDSMRQLSKFSASAAAQPEMITMPDWGKADIQPVNENAQTIEELERKLGRPLGRVQEAIGDYAVTPTVRPVVQREYEPFIEPEMERTQTIEEIRAKIAAQRAEREQGQ